MADQKTAIIDGNEAAAKIAHLCSDVLCIYPITPSSNMGEWADEWSAKGQTNLWGTVPKVVEMQSEAGAAGAVHGALQAGAMTTTFTASQGLLLKIPNMYKIAGELTPSVIHVSARSLAAQALSIFGDHSDVMSARQTGYAFLSSNSVQEAMDMALISYASTLESRIPVLHFFDGFRTSHEVSKVTDVSEDIVRQMIDEDLIRAHRSRNMTPEKPVLRGTAQNPDVYFQGRESVNKHYEAMPGIVQAAMDKFAKLTGRQYKLFEYFGAEDAEKVIIIMGSAGDTTHETVEELLKSDEKVGVLKCRLYRPFDEKALIASLPKSVKKIAVLDRCKEPGSSGEPLYKDVVTAIAQDTANGTSPFAAMPTIVGGRYGLSSKEYTPAMIKGIYEELNKDKPKNSFTVGINDDLSGLSIDYDHSFTTDVHNDTVQALFYGLGSDGTVGANKNSIKIIGEGTDQYTQGYFVYDSKKSGAGTVSHLRFGPKPMRSPYLIEDGRANFIGCHMPVFLERIDMIKKAAKDSVFLLNTQEPMEKIWATFPKHMQEQIIAKNISVYVIDAFKVAEHTGMGNRINTIMQTCFFAISNVLPKEKAIEAIKAAVKKTYSKKGQEIVELNFKAIDETLDQLHKLEIPSAADGTFTLMDPVPAHAPEFVKDVLGEIIAGRGDELPVSKMPCDGTFPTATTQYEKRNIALEIPVWEKDVCIQCGKCTFVCPHSCLRSKVFTEDQVSNAPETFKYAAAKGAKHFGEGAQVSFQVAPEDCTGCGLCADICPAKDKKNEGKKALNMVHYTHELRETESKCWDFFYNDIPDADRKLVKQDSVKGVSMLRPLFEFPGACTGCGETPYIKLISQLYGDRMLVANATGCSSIYGGNMPTTPWATNDEGRGPTWNNSLFEDNAEFGMGMRVAVDKRRVYAEELTRKLADKVGNDLADAILNADEANEEGIEAQRARIKTLREKLTGIDTYESRELQNVSEDLCKKSVWIMGGDGWAYDIGYGGLDHVIASEVNVNILVMDTEVYSNTGGQNSKATPRGAIAKFAAGGKPSGKKDLALMAMSYGNVYVAQIAYGAKDAHTLKAIRDAEAYDGPSIILAYSPCIAHGFDMIDNHRQQMLAVNTGHWPLFRFDPRRAEGGENPLVVDSKKPSVPYINFLKSEPRFSMLWAGKPEVAEKYAAESQVQAIARYNYYTQLSNNAYGADE